jgi:hypothetical protein
MPDPVEPSPIPDEEWDLIIDRIVDGECVPFLGAGASLGAGIPSAGDLAEQIASKIQYPGVDKRDFLRVCQYYAMKTDVHAPRTFVARRVSLPGMTPGIVHTTLAAMPFFCVVTTNFDNLMERAFTDAGRIPDVQAYRVGSNREDLIPATVKHPLVFKLHGSVADPETMVVSEDDTVDFMASVLLGEPPIPPFIKGILRRYSVLFIGYGLKDWNIRVLLRALRGKNDPVSCFAIQRRPSDEALAAEWETMVIHLRQGKLRCYDMEAIAFVTELHNRYGQRMERIE